MQTMGFAYIRNQAYVRVSDLVTALKEQGYDNVAEWLEDSERGEAVSITQLKIRR